MTAELTDFGHEMAVLPTEPLYSKLLVTSLKPEFVAVRSHVAAIVAMLSVENIFFNSQQLNSASQEDK